MLDLNSIIGNQAKNLEAIEKALFDVKKIQLHPNMDGFESPTAYATYKGTGGQPLGVVGANYTPTQPKFLYDSLLHTLMETPNVDADKLKFVEMKDGQKIRFTMPLGSIAFRNMLGKEDVSDVTLNLQTGFDGKTKTSFYLSTYRLICSNGMKANTTEFTASFKNTKGNVGKASSLCHDITKAFNSMERLSDLYKHLNKIEISTLDQNKFVEAVTGYDLKEYNSLHKKKQNIIDNINKSIGIELARTGNTAFGLLNGITYYTNHVVKGCEDKDYIFVGNGDKINDKALKAVLSLT